MTKTRAGVTSAVLDFNWMPRQTVYFEIPIPYYPVEFIADYTILYTGKQPAVVEIAVPMIGVSGPEPDIRVDGEAAELTAYMPFNSIEHTGPVNLAGRATPVFERYVGEIQAQTRPYASRHFDADAPASLYTITMQGSDFFSVSTPSLILRYDPKRTILLLHAPKLDFEPGFEGIRDEDNELVGIRYLYGEIYSNYSFRPDPFEVLVIGDDTIAFDFEIINKVESEHGALHIEHSGTETPRGFIMRTQRLDQRSDFKSAFPTPIRLDDFMLRHTDELLDECIELVKESHNSFPVEWPDVQYRYANVQPLEYISVSGAVSREQSVVASIPFQPGQARVLSVSYSPGTGMEWDKAKQQSLFHHTVLTETARYWDFFNGFTVTTNHPLDTIEAMLSDSFEAALAAQRPGGNIHFGFWLPDEREEPGANWGMLLLFLGLIALRYWPITLVIIFLIILLIRYAVKKARIKSESK